MNTPRRRPSKNEDKLNFRTALIEPEQPKGQLARDNKMFKLPNGRQVNAADHHPKALRLLELARMFDQPHLANHIPRYLHCIQNMPHGEDLRSGTYDSASGNTDDLLFSIGTKGYV